MSLGPYDLADLREGLRNPSLIGPALRGISRSATIRLNDLWYRRRTPDGYDLAAEDWDVLVILDGCRYDTFADVNWLDGTLEPRTSPASESLEFLEANFGGREFHDTVYVTANPHWYTLEEGTFHNVVDLLTDAWDDELGTVLPGSVVEHALRAHEQFPRKRLIVHFMQPHFPFVGEKGRELEHKGITLHQEGGADVEALNVWTAVERGRVSRDEVRAAYEENLELVLPHVETLLEELPGTAVVTSDHGNLLGDRLFPIPIRGYGHPRGLRAPELVTVPWLSVTGDRLSAESDPPTSTERNTEHVEDRLESLGYA